MGHVIVGAVALLLFMYLLGLLLGSIYQHFGRTGEFILFGIAFLLLSVFVLVSTYWHWWGALFGWLAYLREARKYRTVDEENAAIVKAMNSVPVLVGRTVIVAATKS